MTPAITKWVNKNQAKFASPTEREHLVDFLMKKYGRKKSINFSYETAVLKAEAWVKALNKKARLAKTQGQVKTILKFKDGMRFVQLLDTDALKWEGLQMGHCVAGYKTPQEIYSLRDENNYPHATIEVRSNVIRQIKGKSNLAVISRYSPHLVEFLKKTKFKIENQYDATGCGFFLFTVGEINDIKRAFKNPTIIGQYVYDAPDMVLQENVSLIINQEQYPYHFSVRRNVPWYKFISSSLYFFSISKFVNIVNATDFFRQMTPFDMERFYHAGGRVPTLDHYKVLFQRDKDLGIELFEKYGMNPRRETWSEDLDDLCSMLLKKGYKAEALRVFNTYLPFKPSLRRTGSFPKISSLNDQDFNLKIIYSATEVIRGVKATAETVFGRPSVWNPTNFMMDALGCWNRGLTIEQLRLIMKHCPEFDVSVVLSGDNELSTDFIKEAIKLSGNPTWAQYVATKNRPYLKLGSD